jgi:hypothetical protein
MKTAGTSLRSGQPLGRAREFHRLISQQRAFGRAIPALPGYYGMHPSGRCQGDGEVPRHQGNLLVETQS